MINTDDGKRAYMAFAGFWSVIFTLVVMMVVSQTFWFEPRFGAGDQEVVVSTVKSLGSLYVAAKIHEWIQRGLTKYRIADVSNHLWHFDIITSFAPATAAILVITVQQLYFSVNGLTLAAWSYATQVLDCLIIFGATIEDVFPTVRHILNAKPATTYTSTPPSPSNGNGH